MASSLSTIQRSAHWAIVLGLVIFLEYPSVGANSAESIGTHARSGMMHADEQHHHPSVMRRSEMGYNDAEPLPVGSLLFPGDVVSIHWMQAFLDFCSNGEQPYGSPDNPDYTFRIFDCSYREDLPNLLENQYLQSALPLSFGRASAELHTAYLANNAPLTESPAIEQHRLFLARKEDRISSIAAMFGVSEEAIDDLNSKISGADEYILKIPVVPSGKLNWPLVGKMVAIDKTLSFEARGAAVWADGFGEVTVSSKDAEKKESTGTEKTHPTFNPEGLKAWKFFLNSPKGFDVQIDHHNGFISVYRGMLAVTKQTGDFVDGNTLLGSADEELEFGVLKNGEAIDPLSVLAAPGTTNKN